MGMGDQYSWVLSEGNGLKLRIFFASQYRERDHRVHDATIDIIQRVEW